MRISDWSSDVCSSDLGLIFIISVLLFQFRASRLDSLLYPNDVVGGCGIIERISAFASGFGVQMQEWLAPFDLLAATFLHVDASGLAVGPPAQLGDARHLPLFSLADAPTPRRAAWLALFCALSSFLPHLFFSLLPTFLSSFPPPH